MDPNEIVGRPSEREVWLAPGWADYKPITAKQPSGYTRVSVRETTYADGRIVTEVLDENRNPIKTQVLDQQTDDAQARRFQQTQTQTQRQTDQSERRETSTYQGVYPAGHPQAGQPAMVTEYESGPPKYAPVPASAQGTGNATPRIEGTPTGQIDANGQPVYDNNAPIKVWRGPDGRVVKTESLDANERNRWEMDRNQSAGRGPFTDAQIAANTQKNQPSTKQGAVPGYPGWTQTTQIDANNNELTVYTDPQGQTHRSLPAKPETTNGTSVKGADGRTYWVTPGANGGPPTAVPIPGLPAEQQAPSRSTVQGGDGKTYVVTVDREGNVKTQDAGVPGKPQEKYKEVRQGKDGRWYGFTADGKWEEVQGGPDAPGPAGANQGPALPQLVLGQSTEALRTYREQLLQQVTAGTITPIVAQQRWKEASDLAGFYIQESQLVNSEEQSRRSADVSLRTNAMSNATSGFNSALSFIQHINDRLQPGSSAGARAFRAILGMQQLHAREMGAFRNEFSDPSVPRTRGGAGTMAPPSSADRRPPMMAPESAPAAPAPPNAIGAGAVPESITPTPAAPTNTTDAGGVPREYTPASSTVGSGIPPAPPEGGPPISMSEPAEEFAALNSYMPPPMPVAGPEVAVPQSESMVQAPPMQAPTPGEGMSPAMLLAEIRSTPPWRLDAQTVQQARSLGIPEEEIWSTPGRMAAA